MNLILDKKIKLPIKTVTKFWQRFKILKIHLTPLDFGVCFPKRKLVTTYFLCQKVDIIFADKDNIILKILPAVHTEQLVFKKKKTYYTYYLPVGAAEFLTVGEKLILKEDKKKKAE